MKKIIFILLLIAISVWLSVFSVDDNLKIIACDVGQGDAILIQRKTTQILIDGGPNSSVLNCLGKYMPFWDRELELVINTHPELDHYAGLIDVFKNYKVNYFGTNGSTSSSRSYKVLESLVGGSLTTQLLLTKGVVIKADMIHLDILNPEVVNEYKETNNNGVVVILKYNDFKAIFTADVENEVSDKLSNLEIIKGLDYIKVNHHGSRNGMSEKLLKQVNPKLAVISSGKRNSYGHPHAEILQILKKYEIKILRTDEVGDVVLKIN